MAIDLKRPLYVVVDGNRHVTFPMARRTAKSWGKAMKLPIAPYRRALNWGIDQNPGY